jgi:Mce-associated membrane protein
VSEQSNDDTVKDEGAVTADGGTKASDVDESGATELGEKQIDESAENADTPTKAAESSETAKPDKPGRRINWSRVFAFGVLPGLALLLALGAGFLKWQDVSDRVGEMPPTASEKHPSPAAESVRAAKDSTIALLSYKPDTVEQQLTAARDLLTGDFRGSYTSLTNDIVIPGAKQKQISAVAKVPAAASVSAEPNHAVVLVFVDQTVTVGQDAPTDTASSVRVTLDKIGDRWLIAKFDPV